MMMINHEGREVHEGIDIRMLLRILFLFCFCGSCLAGNDANDLSLDKKYGLKVSFATNNPISPDGNYLAVTVGYGSYWPSSLYQLAFAVDIEKSLRNESAELILVADEDNISSLNLAWRSHISGQELYYGYGSPSNQTVTTGDVNKLSYFIAGRKIGENHSDITDVELPKEVFPVSLTWNSTGEILAFSFLDNNREDVATTHRLGFVDLKNDKVYMTEESVRGVIMFWGGRNVLYVQKKDGVYKLGIRNGKVVRSKKLALPEDSNLCGVIDNSIVYSAERKIYYNGKLIYPAAGSNSKPPKGRVTVSGGLIAFCSDKEIFVIDKRGRIICQKMIGFKSTHIAVSTKFNKVFFISEDHEKFFTYDLRGNSELIKLFGCNEYEAKKKKGDQISLINRDLEDGD